MAVEWYLSLSDKKTDKMAQSLDEWERQLRARFQKDQLDARDEVDKLKFSFDREDQLSLREYVTKKAHLLEDAGFQDEDEVVYRIWTGLDPILMNAIQLSHRDNSFSNFTLTLYH